MVETVARGTKKTTKASFTSATNLTNVAVQITPTLQPYISVAPSSFSSIKNGERVTVTFNFSAPSDAPIGTLDGTIHLRSAGRDKRTYAQPLPISLIIFNVETDPEEVLLTGD